MTVFPKRICRRIMCISTPTLHSHAMEREEYLTHTSKYYFLAIIANKVETHVSCVFIK